MLRGGPHLIPLIHIPNHTPPLIPLFIFPLSGIDFKVLKYKEERKKVVRNMYQGNQVRPPRYSEERRGKTCKINNFTSYYTAPPCAMSSCESDSQLGFAGHSQLARPPMGGGAAAEIGK